MPITTWRWLFLTWSLTTIQCWNNMYDIVFFSLGGSQRYQLALENHPRSVRRLWTSGFRHFGGKAAGSNPECRVPDLGPFQVLQQTWTGCGFASGNLQHDHWFGTKLICFYNIFFSRWSNHLMWHSAITHVNVAMVPRHQYMLIHLYARSFICSL